MKKKNLRVVLIIIALVFFNIKVNAATCDNSTKKDLKKEAQQVSVTAELQKPSDELGADSSMYSYDVRILNISKNLNYEIGDWIYKYSDALNGELYVKNAYMMGGYRVSIKITASNQTVCSGEVLRTIYVNLPRYNIYSDREECEGLSEYTICKRTANTENITNDEFLKKVEEAKRKKAEEESQTEKVVEEEESSMLDNFINFVNENKNIIIPITVIIVVLILILIIIKTKKNKNKVKIDLGGEL